MVMNVHASHVVSISLDKDETFRVRTRDLKKVIVVSQVTAFATGSEPVHRITARGHWIKQDGTLSSLRTEVTLRIEKLPDAVRAVIEASR
jgi:hypothetical protein